MARVDVNVDEFADFFAKLRSAARGDFRKELAVYLQSIGADFLKIVEDEIMRQRIVVTSNMVGSFHEGGEGNIWQVSNDGLTLEVGTNVEYAAYVNDGHWTNKKGVTHRFVPGEWQGDRFIYKKGAKTGMVLRQKWIEGKHFWEKAIGLLERHFTESFAKIQQEWLAEYFGTTR